jgi:hypothetical protein
LKLEYFYFAPAKKCASKRSSDLGRTQEIENPLLMSAQSKLYERREIGPYRF